MSVSFGLYVLDPDSRQLLHGDDVVHLSPKAFDLLNILVSHKPKALSKSDLQERLWPGTFVVEKNLANLVSEIRDAIGDDASTRDSFGPSTGSGTRFVTRSRGVRLARPPVAAAKSLSD